MTAIPSKPSFTDSGVTEGEFKTALTQLHDFLTGLLGSAGTQAAAQVALGALAGAGVMVRSSAYTLLATDRGRVVSCTGTWTLGLTSAATLGNGFAFLVANVGSGTITIDPAGTETINGAATYTVGAGATVLVVCVGAAAWVVAGVALSDAIDSNSSTTAASSKAVKTAYDKAASAADVGHNNVGSLVFAYRNQTNTVLPGSTAAGSQLFSAGIVTVGVTEGGEAYVVRHTSLSGTWRCLGVSIGASGGGGLYSTTLWQRIS